MAARILVVDDEAAIRWTLNEHLSAEGYEVIEAGDGGSASKILENESVDLVLLDQRLPDTDGMALLGKVHGMFPELPVIIITAYSSVNSAVEAMRAGALDYITKPFNMDELAIAVKRALETSSLRSQVKAQVTEQKTRFSLASLVGESARMTAIKGLVGKIALSETTTVLLLGESGTGKDMVARAIHYESRRSDKAFINITCSALPEALLESELFGHEKGAFTDAKSRKKGLFELADRGTVFMDEVGAPGQTPAGARGKGVQTHRWHGGYPRGCPGHRLDEPRPRKGH